MKDENGNAVPFRLRLIKSTMTRATQTADIILEQLPKELGLDVETCNLIREGAPIEPEPEIEASVWSPEIGVRNSEL